MGFDRAIDQNQQNTPTYRLDEGWPKYPSDMNFAMGAGVTVDDDGIIYLFKRDIDHVVRADMGVKGGTLAEDPHAPGIVVARRGRSSVSKFDRAGNYVGEWGPADDLHFAVTAHTIDFIGGAFWTVDRDAHVVRKFDKQGNPLLTLGTFDQWGDGPKHFNGPTGVAILGDGRIVVCDGYWNSRVVWFSPQGEYIKEVGGWGTGPGQFIKTVTVGDWKRKAVTLEKKPALFLI